MLTGAAALGDYIRQLGRAAPGARALPATNARLDVYRCMPRLARTARRRAAQLGAGEPLGGLGGAAGEVGAPVWGPADGDVRVLETGVCAPTPVLNEPTIDEPKDDEPMVNMPMVDKSKVDKPLADKIIADEPLVDKPKVDDLKADMPTAKKPKVTDSKPQPAAPEHTTGQAPRRRALLAANCARSMCFVCRTPKVIVSWTITNTLRRGCCGPCLDEVIGTSVASADSQTGA